jgi:hypothetical protein
MFHWVRGIPFDFNAGAYDNLNMWEQIDNGDQYTPAKKYLLSVPIILFLVSTHYTHYDLRTFLLNLVATVLVIIPKLPAVSLISNLCPSNILIGNSLTGYEQHSSPDHQRTGLVTDEIHKFPSALDVFVSAFWEIRRFILGSSGAYVHPASFLEITHFACYFSLLCALFVFYLFLYSDGVFLLFALLGKSKRGWMYG